MNRPRLRRIRSSAAIRDPPGGGRLGRNRQGQSRLVAHSAAISARRLHLGWIPSFGDELFDFFEHARLGTPELIPESGLNGVSCAYEAGSFLGIAFGSGHSAQPDKLATPRLAGGHARVPWVVSRAYAGSGVQNEGCLEPGVGGTPIRTINERVHGGRSSERKGPTMSTMIDEILSQLSADDLATRLGTDPDTAMEAARRALPALLGGLDLEVRSGKADDLGVAALKDHDPALLSRDNPLSLVDFSDGEKIVGHMFGGNRGAVEQRLGAAGTAEEGMFSKLLPMLAPLVMSWLAGRMTGKGGSSASGGGGGGIGDLLGGVLGGGSGTPRGSASAGGGLADLLGGILGGEKEKGKQAMPDLGSIFDMFGGGDEGEGGGFNIGDLLKRG